jgi:hypothetical protein
MMWHKVSFRLTGSLFVGSGRWGFVLPCRPYVPGWTLWGALVVFLKKSGRWQGVDYGEIGHRLNQECWLGHLFLTQREDNCTYCYLPAIEPEQGGKTVFAWRGSLEEPVDCLPPPTFFRHGTARSREQGEESLGRLFLTEIVQPRNYKLTGIFRYDSAPDELLHPGDALRVGGNRQVSGAEIVCETVESCPEELRKQFLRRQHLYCNPADNELALSGELERIVLRRTRTEDGTYSGGVGQHHVDWGCHLAPGWEEQEKHSYQPVKKNGCSRHGTVEPA